MHIKLLCVAIKTTSLNYGEQKHTNSIIKILQFLNQRMQNRLVCDAKIATL